MINPRLTPSPARISATKSFWTKRLLTLAVWLLTGWLAWGNLAGGGTGAGPAVTLTDSGSTVTIANGIISLLFGLHDRSHCRRPSSWLFLCHVNIPLLF